MSFLKELEKLSQPAPSLPDLEDENIEGNALGGTRFAEPDDEDVPQRRRIIGTAFQDDEKYIGEKVSRSVIFGDSSEMLGLSGRNEDSDDDEGSTVSDEGHDSEEEEEEGIGSSNDSEDDDGSISSAELKKAMMNGSYNETEGLDDQDSDMQENDSDAEEEDDDKESDVDEATQNIKNIMLGVDKEKESKKADSVRKQLRIWDQLLFLKIKLQAAIRAYNQLPRGHLAKELMKNADEETRANMIQARKNAKELVELLLSAEKTLLATSPLTQSIVGIEGGMADSDDEEIESSDDEADENDGEDDIDDEDIGDEEDDEEENVRQVANGVAHQSWKSLEKKLKENDDKFNKFRSSTLVKWDERTRLTGPRRAKDAKKDFSAFDKGNVVEQIDKVMSDRIRILKRSQTKRSENDRIGGDPEADIDSEIFDDDDFYQVLLKEMIDKKTNASNDPVAMTRHYIEMQNLKNKRSKKRVFDSRLSKDRKIKFVPIPKLVNFHPARPELVTWTHESRNELFKSLFK